MVATSEPPDVRMPRRRDLPARAAGEEILLRDTDSGTVHFLTAAAALIWECCDGDTTVEACATRLREAFTVPDGVDLTADIAQCLTGLRQRGLVESEATGAG